MSTTDTATTTKIFDVIYGRYDQPAEFVVHKHGCRDVARSGGANWQIEGDDVEAAIAAEVEVYQSQDQGWTREHHHVMPCAK